MPQTSDSGARARSLVLGSKVSLFRPTKRYTGVSPQAFLIRIISKCSTKVLAVAALLVLRSCSKDMFLHRLSIRCDNLYRYARIGSFINSTICFLPLNQYFTNV